MNDTGTLQVTTPTEREIVITREFDAPRRLVFAAWTRPELLKRWLLGPPGWSLEVCEVDLRVGGAFHFVWRGADGAGMGMRGVYREVAPPDRLVHTEVYDEDWTGGETLVTTVLEEQDGGTRMTSTVRYASREARDVALKTGMEEGVAASYDRLADMLASTVSERAQSLAGKFEQANAEAIALVERLSDAEWQTTTGEGWTVAATAHHAAIVHEGIARFI